MQSAQNAQVDGVEVFTRLGDPFRGFENHRHAGEARVRDDPPERFETDPAKADSRVPIHPASPRFDAVVEVQDPDPAQPDGPVERLDGGIVTCVVVQGIARRENMAGIDANSQPLGLGNCIKDDLQMLESVPQATPLPRGGLQVDPDAQPFCPAMHLVQCPSHARQPGLLAAADMRSGVGDDVADSQRLGPFQFDNHGVDRPIPERVVGAGEIDEVRIVRNRSRQTRLRQTFGKGLDLRVGQGLRIPLVIVFGEELQRRKTDFTCGENRVVMSAGGGHVGAKSGNHRGLSVLWLVPSGKSAVAVAR